MVPTSARLLLHRTGRQLWANNRRTAVQQFSPLSIAGSAGQRARARTEQAKFLADPLFQSDPQCDAARVRSLVAVIASPLPRYIGSGR